MYAARGCEGRDGYCACYMASTGMAWTGRHGHGWHPGPTLTTRHTAEQMARVVPSSTTLGTLYTPTALNAFTIRRANEDAHADLEKTYPSAPFTSAAAAASCTPLGRSIQ